VLYEQTAMPVAGLSQGTTHGPGDETRQKKLMYVYLFAHV